MVRPCFALGRRARCVGGRSRGLGASLSSSIEVKNLNVYIGTHHILKNINVDIPEKKITCIIGPSGCGKTTLFKSFNRLLENNADTRIEGKVFLDGVSEVRFGRSKVMVSPKQGLLV